MFYKNYVCYKEFNCCVYIYGIYGLKRINICCKVSVYIKRIGFILRLCIGIVYKVCLFFGLISCYIKFVGIILKWVGINCFW